jgi:small subunit ribosomal protein S4
MIRKKNLYSRPQKPFEAQRIKEENELVKKYGLKNKKEIWKTIAKVNYYRGRAKALANKPHEEQNVLFKKLQALGLKIESVADVLDLDVEDLLRRRLPTVMAQKKLANTPKQARQMVTHKRVKINGRTVNAPSYLVPISEENKIEIKKTIKKVRPIEDKVTEPQAEVMSEQEVEMAEEVAEAEEEGEED